MSTVRQPRVVLVGAHGHGRYHLDDIARLQDAGRLTLAGICDRRPPDDVPGDGSLHFGTDLGEVLAATQPDVTVVCTPIHTHANLAVTAMRAGSDVLLEKPPAPTWSEYRRIAEVAEETGRHCQIGFQDLGSTALGEIRNLLDAGTIGGLKGIGGACAWMRTRDYFTRSEWAGRRVVDGVPVVDGALTNPFAHALASALHLAGAQSRDDLADVDVELYRTNRIEADDTSTVRIRLASGVQILVAATLASPVDHEPHLVLHGTHGRIRLRYKTGEVTVETATTRWTKTFPRLNLLENLVARAEGTASELLAPVSSMGAFMHVVETIRTAPDPLPIPGTEVTEPAPRLVIPGVDEAVRDASERLAHFSELGLPWAQRPRATLLATLRAGATEVATYVDGDALPPTLGPRPHLHPVTTLAGTVVTASAPPDHRWHLGVSFALQDVSGHNLWGGRTYVRDDGYRWRDDHGRTRHLRWHHLADDHLDEELVWLDREGGELLSERRELRASAVDDTGWRLSFRTALTNISATPLSLGSPGSNGRVGGGYGGFFWRLPPGTDHHLVFTPGQTGEESVHGQVAPWLAVSDQDVQGRPWTLVLSPADRHTAADPWFVRAKDYPAVGSSLAWSAPVPLDCGQHLSRSFDVLVLDGRLSTPADVEAALATSRTVRDPGNLEDTEEGQ